MTQNAWWEIISNLFERDELMGRLLERSFRQTSGWGEALLALALVWLAHRLSERLQQHAVFERIRWWVVRHSLKRLLFPFFMLIFGVVAQIVWQLLGFNSAWLRFLVLAAGWMMAIRLCLSLLHAVAPPYHWMDWLERTAAGGLWLCFVLWISGVDTWIINWLDGLSFSVGKSRLSVWTMFTGLLWVGVILLLMTWLARWLNTQLMKSRHIDINLRIVLSKIISSAAVVLSILIALPLVGIDLTVLSVFGGALGVGLGFGLQKIASNYVSGFIILADRSIRPGDRLTVNSFTGYVTQMTARFVVLRSAAGEEALIPNETFVTSTVINESYSTKALHKTLDVEVAYHTDLTLALQILKDAAAAQERVSKEPGPAAYLINFGDNGIQLRVGFWVNDPENGFTKLFSSILLTIWRRFNEENIEFPFPQREVRILPSESAPSDLALRKAKIHEQTDTRSANEQEG